MVFLQNSEDTAFSVPRLTGRTRSWILVQAEDTVLVLRPSVRPVAVSWTPFRLSPAWESTGMLRGEAVIHGTGNTAASSVWRLVSFSSETATWLWFYYFLPLHFPSLKIIPISWIVNLLDQILSFFFHDFSHIFFFLHIFSSLVFTLRDSLCVNVARL